MIHLLAAVLATAVGVSVPAGAPGASATPGQEASGANPAAKPVSKQDRVVCKTKGVSGTRVRARRICGTQRDWTQLSNTAKGAVEEVRNGARGACNPGQPCGGE